MTLIVSLLTNKYVVQVGDTLTTIPQPSGAYITAETARNKLVFYRNYLVLGFCGRAEIGPTPTDIWIRDRLQDIPPDRESDPLGYLKDVLDGMGADFRLAIVATGFSTAENNDPQDRYLGTWRISNFYTELGHLLAEPAIEFRQDTWVPKNLDKPLIVITGWKPPERLVEPLHFKISQMVGASRAPLDVIEALVEFVRRCADDQDSKQTIGKNLLSVFLPSVGNQVIGQSGPTPTSIGMWLNVPNGPPVAVQLGGTPGKGNMFNYWPVGGKEPWSAGPHIVAPGAPAAQIASSVASVGSPMWSALTNLSTRSRYPVATRNQGKLRLFCHVRVHGRNRGSSVEVRLSAVNPSTRKMTISGFRLILGFRNSHLRYERTDFSLSLGDQISAPFEVSLAPFAAKTDMVRIRINRQSTLDREHLALRLTPESVLAVTYFTLITDFHPATELALVSVAEPYFFDLSHSAVPIRKRHVIFGSHG